MATKLNLLRRMLAAGNASKGFERIYQKVEVVAASEGKCTLSWKIDESVLNFKGTMHGGVISSVIDSATTMALYASEKRVRGVSLELSVSFVRAAKPGDTLTIDAFCRKIGNTIAFTEASISNQDGKLIATGKHTKFIEKSARAPKEET